MGVSTGMSVHDTLPTSLGKEETVSYTQLVSPNPVLLSARHDVKMSASVCTGEASCLLVEKLAFYFVDLCVT